MLSRRKFIAAGVVTVAVATVGSTFYLKPDVLTQYLCNPKSKNYDGILAIGQETSPAALDYPGLNEYDVVTKVELLNTANKPLEKLQIVQKAPERFELKSAKLGRVGQFERDYETLQPKVLDNTVVCSLTEPLKPNERYTVVFTHTPGWEAKSGDFQATATAKLYAERYEPCWISELLHIEPQKDYIGINSNTTSATIAVNPAPKPLREIYESGQKEWAKDIAKRKILMQYPVAAELQNKFWKETIEHAGEAIDYFQSELDKSGQPFNELAEELDKIPEIAGTEKYPVNKIDVVKGVENLTYLALLCDTPKENIVAMLNEGYPNVRKYCTPLQALIWLGKNELFNKENNPINPYDVEKLMPRVWFTSDEPPNTWEDFNVVTDRLNFPEAVSLYMFRNIDYSRYLSQGDNIDMIIVGRVFNGKRGNCADQAQFSAYCLKKNGYYARPFVDSTLKPTTHVACLFRDKDGIFYVHDPTMKESRRNPIYGPFSSESSVKLISPYAS